MNIKEELKKPGVKRVILDTDTYNEIDDQFALALSMLAEDRINLPLWQSRTERKYPRTTAALPRECPTKALP